jgi:integrase
MDASNPSSPSAGPARPAWNKGKLTGPKPPLRLGHVWSIRARLQLERRTRDLALFNLAIDSKLRGCDLVAVRVDDVAPNGYAIDRATVRQRKTGRPVRFELTEVTRQAVDDYLRASGLMPGQCLFPGHFGPDRPLTTRQYARLVSQWVRGIGLDPLKYATHSMRRYAESRIMPMLLASAPVARTLMMLELLLARHNPEGVCYRLLRNPITFASGR